MDTSKHGINYSANAGDPTLREAIARHYNYPGMHHAANVCVTTGSQEAMYVTIKTLLDPNETNCWWSSRHFRPI